MSLFNNPSAGVYVQEIDLSQRVQSVSTSIGAIVGQSNKGPLGRPVLMTSTKNFLESFGNPDVSLGYLHYAALAYLNESQRLWCVRVPDDSTYGGVMVKMLGSVNSLEAFDYGMEYQYDDENSNTLPDGTQIIIRTDSTRQYDVNYNFDADDIFVIYGQNPGAWNNKISVRVYPNVNGDIVPEEAGTFFIDVFYDGSFYVSEKFMVSMDYRLDGYGRQMFVESAINDKSAYIRVKLNPNRLSSYKIASVSPKIALAGGTDGTINTQEKVALLQTCWEMFRDPEEIDVNILILGGNTQNTSISVKLDDIARSRMDCVAILDVPNDMQDSIQEVVEYRRNLLNINSSYSALYAPDVYVTDQYNGKNLYVPPSGHIAAIYARTDRLAETWFAPAGMNRGDLNILGLYKVYNQGDRDYLQESQVNPLRLFYGKGIKVWGQDTLQAKASALSNMSVRRLMNFLEKSISITALYSVFEQNDTLLRRSLSTMCTSFLTPIVQKRGIYAFAVVCDDGNNPVDVIANGDLILDVYIDPVLPVKRIHLNAIIPRTGGIQFAVTQMYG